MSFERACEYLDQVSRLREWKAKTGVRVVLTDLDDSPISTAAVFIAQKQKFVEAVAAVVPILNKDEFAAALNKEDQEAHTRWSVDPGRWQTVVENLDRKFSLDGGRICRNRLSIIEDIYRTPPEIKEGALTTLDAFKTAGLRIGTVTHAKEDWTNFKLRFLGLNKYFEHVILAQIDKPKDWESWAVGVERFGVGPEEVLGIGDSIEGDIVAARQAGIRHLIWVPSTWRVNNLGQLPEGTIVVPEGFGKIIERLIEAA